jgi:hypothetical protein
MIDKRSVVFWLMIWKDCELSDRGIFWLAWADDTYVTLFIAAEELNTNFCYSDDFPGPQR